jgi:hypothetical protein
MEINGNLISARIASVKMVSLFVKPNNAILLITAMLWL